MALNNKAYLKIQADLIRYEEKDGLNTAERVGKLFVDLINDTDASLTEASVIAGNAQSTADNALSKAENAQERADEALGLAQQVYTKLQSLLARIGIPGGIATLDDDGILTASQRPSYNCSGGTTGTPTEMDAITEPEIDALWDIEGADGIGGLSSCSCQHEAITEPEIDELWSVQGADGEGGLSSCSCQHEAITEPEIDALWSVQGATGSGGDTIAAISEGEINGLWG